MKELRDLKDLTMLSWSARSPNDAPPPTYKGLELRDGGRGFSGYRGISLIRNKPPLGPYSRTMPRALRWSEGGGQFIISEVPL